MGCWLGSLGGDGHVPGPPASLHEAVMSGGGERRVSAERALKRHHRYLPQNGLPDSLAKVQSIKPAHFRGRGRRPGQVEAGGVKEVPLLHTDLKGESRAWRLSRPEGPGLGQTGVSAVSSSHDTSLAGQVGAGPEGVASAWTNRAPFPATQVVSARGHRGPATATGREGQQHSPSGSEKCFPRL